VRYQVHMNTSRIAIGFLGAACLLAAAPAHAQRSAPGGRPVEPPSQAAAAPEPPPALPGSRAEATAVAPATRPALDMAPTDALFDAVNRGDLAAAKDALNRGADIGARNVLGLTALDLAIDLGRNDITFALLAMRGSDTPRQPAVATAAAQPTSRAARRQAAQQSVQVRRARYAESSPAAAQAPRRFAGDGGTPNPAAGFLGFDSSR